MGEYERRPAAGPRVRRSRSWVRSTCSGDGAGGSGSACPPVERRGQREDGLAVLDGRDPAGGEGAAVPDAVHGVDDGHGGITGPDEVRVQRVHRPLGRDGPARGDQRLPGHLAAEHTLGGLVGTAAAEDVHLDLLQVEQIEQAL